MRRGETPKPSPSSVILVSSDEYSQMSCNNSLDSAPLSGGWSMNGDEEVAMISNNNNNNLSGINAPPPDAASLQSIYDQILAIRQCQEREVESMRRRIQYQEQQLSSKEKEIRRLEKERCRQQEERALELRSLVRRSANNPYSDDNHFRTSRFITRIKNGQIKRSDLIIGAFFVMFLLHLRSASRIPSTAYVPNNTNINNQPLQQGYNMGGMYDSTLPLPQTENQIDPTKLYRLDAPWNSKPPSPIELYNTKDKFNMQRHECLENIRSRHDNAFKPILLPATEHPILLVDPAYHGNVGDHMLTVGEIEYVERHLELPAMDQCHYVQAGGFYRVCTEVIYESPADQTKHALWHAGGNWGDLWRDAQDIRIPSIRTLLSHGYTIISMPQSLYYSDKDLEKQDAMELKALVAVGLGLIEPPDEYYYNVDWSEVDTSTIFENPTNLELAHSRVILSWREQESYELAQQLYPFVRNVVVPDIAFQLGPYEPIRTHPDQEVDIVVFLRNDKESKVSPQRNDEYVGAIFQKVSPNKEITFHIVDWPDRLDMFDESDYFFTSSAIELLSLGKVIVCDRLHAAILSYLVGIPFVYIDQVSGKITKTLNVAFSQIPDCANGEKNLWEKAMNLSEALEKAVSMMEKYDNRETIS